MNFVQIELAQLEHSISVRRRQRPVIASDNGHFSEVIHRSESGPVDPGLAVPAPLASVVDELRLYAEG
jgi:hypothetical protein